MVGRHYEKGCFHHSAWGASNLQRHLRLPGAQPSRCVRQQQRDRAPSRRQRLDWKNCMLGRKVLSFFISIKWKNINSFMHELLNHNFIMTVFTLKQGENRFWRSYVCIKGIKSGTWTDGTQYRSEKNMFFKKYLVVYIIIYIYYNIIVSSMIVF